MAGYVTTSRKKNEALRMVLLSSKRTHCPFLCHGRACLGISVRVVSLPAIDLGRLDVNREDRSMAKLPVERLVACFVACFPSFSQVTSSPRSLICSACSYEFQGGLSALSLIMRGRLVCCLRSCWRSCTPVWMRKANHPNVALECENGCRLFGEQHNGNV